MAEIYCNYGDNWPLVFICYDVDDDDDGGGDDDDKWLVIVVCHDVDDDDDGGSVRRYAKC